MIFKLISKTEESREKSETEGGAATDFSTRSSAGDVSSPIQERLEQLEEMRGVISGFAESGHGGSASNGHVRRLGYLKALLEKFENEARRTAELESELLDLKKRNAELSQQAAIANDKVGSDDMLMDSLRRQLEQTRAGLTSATAELESQSQRMLMLEAKVKSGNSRIGSQQSTIDELHVALEAEKAERILAARKAQQRKEDATASDKLARAATKDQKRLETKLERSELVAKSKAASVKSLEAELKALRKEKARAENSHKQDEEVLRVEIASYKKALATSRRQAVSLEKRIERKDAKIAGQATVIKGLQASNRKLSSGHKSPVAKPRARKNKSTN